MAHLFEIAPILFYFYTVLISNFGDINLPKHEELLQDNGERIIRHATSLKPEFGKERLLNSLLSPTLFSLQDSQRNVKIKKEVNTHELIGTIGITMNSCGRSVDPDPNPFLSRTMHYCKHGAAVG